MDTCGRSADHQYCFYSDYVSAMPEPWVGHLEQARESEVLGRPRPGLLWILSGLYV